MGVLPLLSSLPLVVWVPQQRSDTAYHKTLNWMRCRLSFSLLRSAVMCLRGSQSSKGCPALPAVGDGDIKLALCDGQVSY